jgi:dTDP-4-dehydrorhamnose 3,5-epimerase-like enzyme
MYRRKLKAYADERGWLFETHRDTDRFLAMSYTVLTQPGYGRDLTQWHIHQCKEEVFIPLYGVTSLAVRDAEGAVTVFELNAADPCAVTVNLGEGHSVANFSDQPSVLLVFCDDYYDPKDEGREPMVDWQWDKLKI